FRVKKLKELRESVENIFGYYLNEVVIPEPKSDINSEYEDGQSSDADYTSLEDDQSDQLHISSENEDVQSDEDETEYISLEDNLSDYLSDLYDES
ncbi:6847_t:CDS:1, partial [Dentiscutata heterogama]